MKQPKYPCRSCIYYNACGDKSRTMPCKGRKTESEKKGEQETMIVKNEIYIVYEQDMEGRNVLPRHFLDRQHACKYAIATKGKIAYNMPTVCQITIVYNTDEINVDKYAQSYHTLSEDEIQCYAKE